VPGPLGRALAQSRASPRNLRPVPARRQKQVRPSGGLGQADIGNPKSLRNVARRRGPYPVKQLLAGLELPMIRIVQRRAQRAGDVNNADGTSLSS
jgi:hypothetical protein